MVRRAAADTEPRVVAKPADVTRALDAQREWRAPDPDSAEELCETRKRSSGLAEQRL